MGRAGACQSICQEVNERTWLRKIELEVVVVVVIAVVVAVTLKN
jgi:hypothetical protein